MSDVIVPVDDEQKQEDVVLVECQLEKGFEYLVSFEAKSRSVSVAQVTLVSEGNIHHSGKVWNSANVSFTEWFSPKQAQRLRLVASSDQVFLKSFTVWSD